MYSKLHLPGKIGNLGPKIGKNSGSCSRLAAYLSKELTGEKDFFSHCEDNVPLQTVVSVIDGNVKRLKQGQDKFYMLSYNLSEREAAHLVRTVTGKNVSSLDELDAEDRAKVFAALKDYIRSNMEIYAANFNRNSPVTAADLVYFAKIEENRFYSHEDPEVRNGTAVRGEKKTGFNLHAHVIVSRNDRSQSISLSPFSRARSNINKLNGREVRNGFNMMLWQYQCSENFRHKFDYLSSRNEMFYINDFGYYRYLKKKVWHQKPFIIPKKILAEEIKLIRDWQAADRMLSGIYVSRKAPDTDRESNQ